MTCFIRMLFACGLLAAAAMSNPLMAQNAAPTDAAGQTAPPGTPTAPPKNVSNNGGRRPPTDATGQTAPAGTPATPSRLANPSTATPSAPATTRK